MQQSQNRNLRLGALIACLCIAASLLGATSTAAAATFTFSGGGWGHGIGLSQYGAKGYAEQGKTYDWILSHYYQGTRLVTKPSATVRVNLDKSASARSQWRIQAGSTTSLTISQADSSTVSITLDPDTAVWITTSGGNTKVCRDTVDSSGNHKPGTIIKTFSGGCIAKAGGLVRIISASGPFGHGSVAWRGYIRFYPYTSSTSRAINFVSIENYLYGVVPRESPSSWPAEALKAQAVAARSYAYQDAVDGRVIYCTTSSQVYNGYGRPGNGHEAASTNAAVDATAGKVVWYGTESKPVKTYFSSCSGGHTASIEDVWVTASPKPYYTGVSDADSASPYYRWSVGPLSGTTIGSKVRTQDANGAPGLDYSAPYPASISSISLERAHSGYTHHATLRWSNGQSFRVRGDTLRSALGLKSTKFWLKPTYLNREQSDYRIAWAGNWRTLTRSLSYGGSERRANAAESRLWITYKGTGFKWIATRAASFGKASVYVDGDYKSTVDLYSSATRSRQTIYSISGQSDTTHTVCIRVRGMKRSAATGTWVSVDRITITGGDLIRASVPTLIVQDSSTSLLKFGTWSEGVTGAEGGTHLFSKTPKSRIVLTFIGDKVRWLSRTAPNRGLARVTLDGKAQTVDCYTASVEDDHVLLNVSGLTWGTHTLVIEPLGLNSANSTDSYVSLDSFVLPGGVPRQAVPLTTRVEETSSLLHWSGTWTKTRAGNAVWSASADSAMVAPFTGTGIAWVGSKAPHLGKAAVFVDGAQVAVIDCYRSSPANGVTLFSTSSLAPGDHELRISPLRQRAPASTGYGVLIDAIKVTGWLR